MGSEVRYGNKSNFSELQALMTLLGMRISTSLRKRHRLALLLYTNENNFIRQYYNNQKSSKMESIKKIKSTKLNLIEIKRK
jgi:hypothetical protein